MCDTVTHLSVELTKRPSLTLQVKQTSVCTLTKEKEWFFSFFSFTRNKHELQCAPPHYEFFSNRSLPPVTFSIHIQAAGVCLCIFEATGAHNRTPVGHSRPKGEPERIRSMASDETVAVMREQTIDCTFSLPAHRRPLPLQRYCERHDQKTLQHSDPFAVNVTRGKSSRLLV